MSDLEQLLRSAGVTDPLPIEVVDALASLGAVSQRRPFTHGNVRGEHFTLAPLSSALPGLGRTAVEAPGITTGLQAQVACLMSGNTMQEWALDLDLDRVAIVAPDLRAAREVRTPAAPTRLEPLTNATDVRIVGRAVLRIAATDGQAPSVSFIDRLDEVDPFGDHGAFTTFTAQPPSFFLGSSRFGMTVRNCTSDRSRARSPGGHAPAWKGFAIERATLFLPPNAAVLGDVSLGVRGVFLGEPLGVEGTAFLEFGGEQDTPLVVTIEYQDPTTHTWSALTLQAVDTTPGIRQDRYTAAIPGVHPPVANLRAAPTPAAAGSIDWTLNGRMIDPTGFDAMPGDVLEARQGNQAGTHVAFTGSFPSVSTVDVSWSGHDWANVTSLAGGAGALAGAEFAHAGGTAVGTYTWRWDDSAAAAATFTPTAAQLTVGHHTLVLHLNDEAVRRVDLQVWSSEGLLIGCQAGVFAIDAAAPGTVVPVEPVEVSNTYELGPWHFRGERTPADAATVSGGAVQVEAGSIAEVSTDRPAGTVTLDPPPSGYTVPAGQLHYIFDTTDPTNAASDVTSEWVQALPAGTHVAVIGRCDDLGTAAYNQALAERRAERTVQLLTHWGLDTTRIEARGEQDAWPATVVTDGMPAEATQPPAWKAHDELPANWPQVYGSHESERAPYRRADLYVYTPAPTPAPEPTGTPTQSTARLRALVPGADPTTDVGASAGPDARKHPQYRVVLEVEWNDPAAAGLGDAVPIRAEALVQWPGTAVQVPPPGSGTTPVTSPANPTQTPVWSLKGRWAHNQTSGDDDFTLSLDVAGNPNGIAALDNKLLAATFGLAPALVGAADNPSGGEAALVAALATVIGGLASTLLRDGSRTVVTGVTIDRLERGPSDTSRTRLTVDYTVELSVDVQGALPLHASTRVGKPMKLRYRGVGVEIDTAAAHWYDGIGLVTRDSVPEIVDPGSWQLGPPLDDLLRVTGTRSGSGSSWLEVDLALSIDLGVVTLSNATVRVSFDGAGIRDVELRGLTAKVDIPATLTGEGAVSVANGSISAGVQLEVVPVKVAAIAALTLGDHGFLALQVGVRFPAAIPFANSGLGLYGLAGRFVSNGTRDVQRQADVVKQELDWLAKADQLKYTGMPGQYALGLGAVIGTAADDGFTFNAKGMVTVEFPRPAVIFSIIATVISETAPVPSEQVPAPADGGLSIIGLVVIDDTAVTIAMRGHYAIQGVLEVEVPFGAHFPYVDPTASYLHVGVDNQPGREGSPVTVHLLPDILDVHATSYLMVHGNGLLKLGGHDDFNFQGFSVGFGAGFGIDWSAGPIRLTASAEFAAGFGTNPFFLAAGIWVRGELDLVVLSISARGEITVRTDGHDYDVHGKFCGEVDCFFFSISGCVEIDISNTLAATPAPDSPVSGVDLVARMGHATAAAAPDGSGNVPTVWIDTIPVVHFAHTMENGVAAGAQFAIGQPMPGPVWSGSRDVKHAFRLTGVSLVDAAGTPVAPAAGGSLDAAWWWPGIRSTQLPPWQSAHESEPRDLALLAWQPWGGLLPLTQPEGSPGDPGGLVGSVCDPVRRPDPLCLVGELGTPTGAGSARLPEDPALVQAGRGPTSLRLDQPGDRPWPVLLALASSYGLSVSTAHVTGLHLAAELATGPRKQGWRLAGLVRQGQELGSLGATGTYVDHLCAPSLVLEVCRVRTRRKDLEPLPEGDFCVRFGDLDDTTLPQLVDASGALPRQGIRVHDTAGDDLRAADFTGAGTGLLIIGKGLTIAFDQPVKGVVLHGQIQQTWSAIAYDHDGNQLVEAKNPEGSPLHLLADGIAQVVLQTEGENVLTAVCPDDRDPAGETAGLLAWNPTDDRLPLPAVLGILPDGSEVEWSPKVGQQEGDCTSVTFVAPDDREYDGFRIPAAPGLAVTVVGTCGTLWHEELEVRNADQARQDVISLVNDHATGPLGTVRASTSTPAGGPLGALALPVDFTVGPPVRTLLQPATDYQVRVDWEWQRWERVGDTQPGSPDPNAWQPGTTSVFRFRTAAALAHPTPPPPVQYVEEASFDPRSLIRYVQGARPAGGLPHLLDDPIQVNFSVDYVPKFLQTYGYEARVEVRPSDVDTGSVPLTDHPFDVVTAVSVLAGTDPQLILPVEQRVNQLVSTAPCLSETSPTGSTAAVVADLDPVRGYDMILVAHPTGGGADTAIGRWHFRTSRYRDVGEILTDCGLDVSGTNPVAPADVLLDLPGGWPTGLATQEYDDRTFDTWISALNRDPWPMPSTGRTTTLWLPPTGGGNDWQLAGLLLEGPEPLARPGRVSVSAGIGGSTFSVLASTGNGTRLLMAPASPITVAATDVLTVEAHDALRSTTFTARVMLLGQPRTVRGELV